MAVGAQLPVRFEQQFFIGRLVGIVTGGTVTVFDRLMLNLGFGELLLNLMAFGAQLAIGLEQQLLEIRTVGVMAGEAFAVFDGLMFGLGGLWEWVMALETQGWGKLDQQLRVRGLMGIVAGSAFAILDGLMFNFAVGQRVVMARETDRRSFARHSLGRPGLVAFGALAVGVGWVDEVFHPFSLGGRLGNRVGRRRSSRDRSRGSVGARARHRHSVKEGAQPLLFSRTRAASHECQGQKQRDQCAAGRNWPRRGGVGIVRFVWAHQAAFRAQDYFREPNP